MKSYAAISIAIPLLVLGLPLLDTLFAIIRRIVTRKPVMQADRRHFHHRLMDMGLSQRQSVLIMYIVSGTLGLVRNSPRRPRSAQRHYIASGRFNFHCGRHEIYELNDSISDEYVKDQDKPQQTSLPDKNVNKPSDGVTK
ncbi:MAG: hypothetical protein ACOX4M_01255 [Acetivibrionales bacterium]